METVGAWVSSDPLIPGVLSLLLVLLILWWLQAAWKKLGPELKEYGKVSELLDEITRVRSRIFASPSMDNWSEADIAIRWAQLYFDNGRIDAARDELEHAKTLLRRYECLIRA